jgi:flagellar basal body-associated protein FliL
MRNYFAAKTADELTPRNEENIKIEIRNEINDTILNRGKIKKVSFDKLNVVTQ